MDTTATYEFPFPEATDVADGATQIAALAEAVEDQLVITDAAHAAHLVDPAGAHAASAVSFVPANGLSSTDVQAAVAEVKGDLNEAVIDAAGVTAEALAVDPAFTSRYGTIFAPRPSGVAATDTANINGAIAIAAALPLGGRVLLHEGTYATNAQIVVPPLVSLKGVGQVATNITYSGTGFAIYVGNVVQGTPLAYGCAVEDLSIIPTHNDGGGITLVETAMAVVRNVYIECVITTNNSIGCQVDGGDTANIFTYLENVLVNHTKYPHVWTTTGGAGSLPCTSITAVNCTGLSDSVAGSIGLTISAACGQGSRWYGGNLEACAKGVSNAGVGVVIDGLRCEGAPIVLEAGADGNVTCNCIDLASYTDNSGRVNNAQYGNVSSCGTNPATVRAWDLGEAILGGIRDIQMAPREGYCEILTTEGAGGTSAFYIQAGGGSASMGGGLVLYGGGHASKPGDAAIGLSSNQAGARFRVNAHGLDSGGNVFAVGLSTGLELFDGNHTSLQTVTLVGGTLVVPNNLVRADSVIILTSQADGGAPGFLRVSARTPGTNFTILSSSATDTSLVGYLLINPL